MIWGPSLAGTINPICNVFSPPESTPKLRLSWSPPSAISTGHHVAILVGEGWVLSVNAL